jgi:hypothetical protein
MSDRQADAWLWFALFAWMATCVHQALGMLIQVPVIIYLVSRCDMKALPALMILMLGPNNIAALSETTFALKLGITLTPVSCFTLSTFLFVLYRLVTNRYDRPTSVFGWFWMLSAIPAFWISFQAKGYGLQGVWSGPVMSFFAPAVYFWGVSMGCTYEQGRHYFVIRILWVMMLYSLGCLLLLMTGFTFIPSVMILCLAMYMQKKQEYSHAQFIAGVAVLITLAWLLFGRARGLDAAGLDVAEADKIGSTFSTMAVAALGVLLSVAISRNVAWGFARNIPILMVLANLIFVSFIISTQAGNYAKDVDDSGKFQTLQNRFMYKLFGDRATVWASGWEDATTPPYIIKDLRIFYTGDAAGGQGMKLLPHNQYITFVSQNGWWLGIVLSLFIIWVQIRAFRVMTYLPQDKFISKVVVPVGASIFCVLGLTGNSCLGGDLWGNGLATSVLPGVVYGYWDWRRAHANILVK